MENKQSTQVEKEARDTSKEVANLACLDSVDEYKNNEAFLKDLDDVFKEDYGVELNKEELKESGRNLSAMLTHFL